MPNPSPDISPKLRHDLEKMKHPDVGEGDSAEQPKFMLNCKHDQNLKSRSVDSALEPAVNIVSVQLSPEGEC